MRIVLNVGAATWLGGRYYFENLVHALEQVDAAERPELLVNGDLTLPAAIGAHVQGIPADADVVFPNWGLRRTARVAQMHWIPDLQHRMLPGNFGRFDRLRRDLGYRRLAAQAALIVVSSESVREAAERAYRGARGKLRVLHFRTVPPDDVDTRAVDTVAAKYGLSTDYLLLPNQFWAHKNHATAIEALDALPLPLVCTGEPSDSRRPGFAEALIERASNEKLRILGVVPRDDYFQLVRGAAAIIQPSLFEGWSSTVEDARAFGKPIALSDIPVHREQDPPRGFFFGPMDAAGLARAATSAIEAGSAPETEARRRQTELVAAYASRFIEIAAEASGTIGR